MSCKHFLAFFLSIILIGKVYAQKLLKPEMIIEDSLETGQVHAYEVISKTGDLFQLVVEQKGIDLIISLKFSEDTSIIQTFDSPNGINGPEFIEFFAKKSGKYLLEVQALAEYDTYEKGNYSITFQKHLNAAEYKELLEQEEIEREELARWIKKVAIPLSTIEAGNDYEDLMPMKEILKDKRVIGLGEATHGSREFFQMKHRFLEFLVKELDVTLFGIEASYSRCNYINDYVLHGRGSLDTAVVIQGFWTWRTKEVRDMIQWMREYNQTVTPDKKVQFVGYDLQINDAAVYKITRYLEKIGKRTEGTDSLLYKIITEPSIYSGDTSIRQVIKPFHSLLLDILQNKGKYTQQTSKQEYESALQHMRILDQYLMSYGYNFYAGEVDKEYRDYYMAENILYWLNQVPSDNKMVVWAHNVHLVKDSIRVEGMMPGQHIYSDQKMGVYLKEAIGKAYYAVGFDFYEGNFQARNMDKEKWDLEEQYIGPAPKTNFGHSAMRADLDKAFIDFSNLPQNSVIQRLMTQKETGMFSVGSAFSAQRNVEQFIASVKLAKAYDGIIFIKNTTRARPVDNLKIDLYRLSEK